MTSWIRLVPARLRGRLSDRELDALRRANAAFNDDLAQEILDQTAQMARGFIAANAKNVLARETATIPPALVSTCLDIALVDYSSGVGGVLLDPKGVRQKAYDRAVARLQLVAENKFIIEQPPAAEAEAAPAASSSAPPTFYVKPTKLSRADQKGAY